MTREARSCRPRADQHEDERALRHAAIHEAGHAVMLHLLRASDSIFPEITHVSITADKQRAARGHTGFAPTWGDPSTWRKLAFGLAAVAWAGCKAELLHFGCCADGYVKDMDALHGYLTRSGIGEVERVSLVDQIEASTEELLSQPQVKDATVALAGELTAKRWIPGREASEIIERALFQ